MAADLNRLLWLVLLPNVITQTYAQRAGEEALITETLPVLGPRQSRILFCVGADFDFCRAMVHCVLPSEGASCIRAFVRRQKLEA